MTGEQGFKLLEDNLQTQGFPNGNVIDYLNSFISMSKNQFFAEKNPERDAFLLIQCEIDSKSLYLEMQCCNEPELSSVKYNGEFSFGLSFNYEVDENLKTHYACYYCDDVDIIDDFINKLFNDKIISILHNTKILNLSLFIGSMD
jgi:hypothetical protein